MKSRHLILCFTLDDNAQMVKGEEAQTAASLMVALLGVGLGTGAFLSNFFVKLL